MPSSGTPASHIMANLDLPSPRCLVATVALGRASVPDDIARVVMDELIAGAFVVPRSLTVHREKQFIEQLVSNVATSNEADGIILIGGAGIGPRDYACEAVDELADRRVEGFGEAYRRLLLEGGDVAAAALTRATAGVCNQCVVIALPRQNAATIRRAMKSLVMPLLPIAIRIAAGLGPASAPRL
jgi:molybdopterin biosynthesis enzyme MoaB